jgi:hypothetical protein
MKITEKFVVYQGAEPALFPGLTRASNGDLLISYCTRFDCQPGGRAYLLRSENEGRKWSAPASIHRSEKTDGCINLSVGMTTLRDGSVLYPCCDARITRTWDQHDADLIILRSGDHGLTWSAPAPVPVGVKEPFAYGRIVELSSGDLICPIWGKRRAEEQWTSGLVRSQDGGRNWGEHVAIAYDPDAALVTGATDPDVFHCAGYNETTLLELPDGRILAILRQQGVEGRKRDLHRSESSDGGRTWSKPGRLNIWGTSPSLHLMPSGDVLLGYRNHLGNPQGLAEPGVGLSLSRDGGLTWSEHMMLEDPRGYRYRHEFDAGYPAFLDLDEHRMLVAFYSFDPTLPAERYLAANIVTA